MRRVQLGTIILTIALMILSGCGAQGSPATATPTEVIAIPPTQARPQTTLQVVKETPMSSTEPTNKPYDPAMEPLVEAAKEDLAQRLGTTPEQIEVIEAEPVVWPDSSLGCPQPGMFYTQVLQEGARVRLSAGGQVYEYHSGRNRPPFLCENPSKDTGLTPGGE